MKKATALALGLCVVLVGAAWLAGKVREVSATVVSEPPEKVPPASLDAAEVPKASAPWVVPEVTSQAPLAVEVSPVEPMPDEAVYFLEVGELDDPASAAEALERCLRAYPDGASCQRRALGAGEGVLPAPGPLPLRPNH